LFSFENYYLTISVKYSLSNFGNQDIFFLFLVDAKKTALLFFYVLEEALEKNECAFARWTF